MLDGQLTTHQYPFNGNRGFITNGYTVGRQLMKLKVAVYH